MPRTLCALALSTWLAVPAAAGTLYSLSSIGTLHAIDPATGQYVSHHERIRVPGWIVTSAHGLGVHPVTGAVYGLTTLADACSLDPSRTLYVDDTDGDDACGRLAQSTCEQAFQLRGNGEPVSCAWTEFGGCEAL